MSKFKIAIIALIAIIAVMAVKMAKSYDQRWEHLTAEQCEKLHVEGSFWHCKK